MSLEESDVAITCSIISEERDQFTQTSISSVLKRFPLPGDVCKHKNRNKDLIKYPEVIQGAVQEETSKADRNTQENNSILNRENLKAWCKFNKDLTPLLAPQQVNTDSFEILLTDSIKPTKRRFFDKPLSLEEYGEWKSLNKVAESFVQSSSIKLANAQTSYTNMEEEEEQQEATSKETQEERPDLDKRCLTDCTQAEDVKKCKQACKELNEERKSEDPRQKPKCGVPGHKPPKCEIPPNCRPKIKKVCPKGSGSSSKCDEPPDEVLVTSNVTKLGDNLCSNGSQSNAVIITDLKYDIESDDNAAKRNVHPVAPSNFTNYMDENKQGHSETVSELMNKIESSDTLNDDDNYFDNNAGVLRIVDSDEVGEENEYDYSEESMTSSQYESLSQKMLQAHSDAISAIKSAMDDFIGIVKKATHETVSLIAKESVRALERIKASDTPDNLREEERENEAQNSEQIKNISFFRKDEPKEKVEEPCSAKAPANILAKVQSSISILGGRISKSIDDFSKRSFNNQSSPYDKDENPHSFTPEEKPGMFSAIKSKIYSMFNETEGSSSRSRSDD